MMKAYDRVQWHYLEAIMLKFGFSYSTVRLILKYVFSVRFSVRVKGELLPFFTLSRMLRQGDPISPYLFLLCGEDFSALSNHYGGASVDCGIRVSLQALWINHLLNGSTINTAAHICAKVVCKLLSTSSWLVCNPDFLTVSLLTDWTGTVLAE
jgi:hypothetical protein